MNHPKEQFPDKLIELSRLDFGKGLKFFGRRIKQAELQYMYCTRTYAALHRDSNS